MTTPNIHSIGYCVNYTQQGDWAFDLAFDIAQRYRLQLNIFHFLSDPYNPADNASDSLKGEARSNRIIEMERYMRLYYDDRLGDYTDVGFRLCEYNEWTELHRCLNHREFQLLVLGLPSRDATFGRRNLVSFANSFVCPVVLVGPDSQGNITLNDPARLISYRLGLEKYNRPVAVTSISNICG